MAAFTMQVARRREPDTETQARFGFTVTRKVGNAVVRNRIRRRLREALRLADALSSDPRTDYVVVAQSEVLGAAFARLRQDLETAVRRGNDPARNPRRADRPEPSPS